MKKVLALVLAMMFVLAGLVGCGNKSVDGTKLIIGGVGPLTGDYSTYGVSVKKGAQLAVDEINSAGGVNGITLELKFEDDQAKSSLAVQAYSLLMDKGMQVSLGAVTSGSCIAISEIAKNDGVLMITPSGSQLECIKYDNAFRICFNDPDQGKYSAKFISDNNIASKVAIIYDSSNDYSVGLKDSFVAQAAIDGLEIVVTRAFTSDTNTDFSDAILAAKNSGADLVFLPLYAAEAASILTQADGVLDDSVIFFGCDGLDGVLKKIDDANDAEGVMLLTPFAADATDSVTVKFVTAYKAANGGEIPDQFAADGYDAIYTIAAALKKAGITDTSVENLSELLIDAMTKITVSGVTGTMTWNENGEPEKSATAVIITDGEYVAYSK